jgi:ADP-L-glycero-D-manno-heptose 6-epimerase
MIVVTGGAGFIGSNLVHALNARGRTDIIVVDDLNDGHKFANLATAQIADYFDRDEFRRCFVENVPALRNLECVYHLGACSDTTEWNGRYMLDNNFGYSKTMLAGCQARRIPLVYASSAAVYGARPACVEGPAHEHPLNVYGYSKLLFDQYVRRHLPTARAPVFGLRYFNVYGPGEQHKQRMASVIFHFNRQVQTDGVVRLFGASHGVGPGEQRRDFVHVADAVEATLWCGDQHGGGIFNCGTGTSATFNEVARAVLDWHGRGRIEYVPFPDDLRAAYQAHTRADLQQLRAAGCNVRWRGVAEGVRDYLDRLNS